MLGERFVAERAQRFADAREIALRDVSVQLDPLVGENGVQAAVMLGQRLHGNGARR